MAYSYQPLDLALDSLGRSYVDEVTVKIASKYCVDCDLEQVKNILNSPGPSVLSFDSNYDTSLEKKVLEDFEKRKFVKENLNKERKERIEKYEKDKAEELATIQKEEEEKALDDERKRLHEIEAEKKARIDEEESKQLELLKLEEEKDLQRKLEEEAEWKKFEEERLDNNTVPVSDNIETVPTGDTTSEEGTVNEEFNTPPQEADEELSSSQIQVKGIQSTQTAQNLQINFSDFEALSDPFADLELKTINDLAELQTILTSNPMSAPQPVPCQTNYFPSTSSVISNHQSHQASGPVSQANQGSLQYSSHPSQNFSTGQYQQPGSHSNFYSNIPRQSPNQALNQNQFNNLPSHLAYPNANQQNFTNFSAFNSTTNACTQPTPTCTTNAYNHQPQNSSQNPFYPNYTTSTQAYSSTPGYTMSSSSNPGYVSTSTISPSYNVYNPGLVPPTYQPIQQAPAVSSYETKGSRSVSSDRRKEKLKDNSGKPGSGELKPSCSVGDMISELQKEAQAHQDQKRKSVTSPNPTSRPASRGATGLENWTPWPKLDQEQPLGPQKQKSVEVDDYCLKTLLDDEANICRQLQEMGFPLSRLAKGCQAVGVDSQKLINFCLVVDRLVEEGFSVADSEEVAMLHNAEEDVCRKHLKSFQQLAEIGFPSKDVHQALIANSFDHQKALEQLIR